MHIKPKLAVILFLLFVNISISDVYSQGIESKKASNLSKKEELKNSESSKIYELISAVQFSDTSALRSLIRGGADINQRDSNGFYPLYWAQVDDKTFIIDELESLGAIDYNKEAEVFFRNCENGNLDSVKILLENGFDVNSRKVSFWFGEEGVGEYHCYETGLARAVKSGNLDLVDFLINSGATISFDSLGVQPLLVALKNRKYNIADLLLKNGANKRTIFVFDESYYSYLKGDTAYFNYLIKNEFPYVNNDTDSPLLLAVQDDNTLFIDKLSQMTNIEDRSHSLCHAKSIKAASILLSAGAEINTKYYTETEGECSGYYSPLNQAVDANNFDLVKFLINNGSDPNLLNNEHGYIMAFCMESPLIIAVKNKNLQIAAYLIKNGANVNYQLYDTEGEVVTALILAVRNNAFDIVNILLSNQAAMNVGNKSILEYTNNETDKRIIDILKQYNINKHRN